MADRPILFSAPMVRALLAGTKTQTRRILPTMETCGRTEYPGRRDKRGMSRVNWLDTADGMANAVRECRYGQPGDQLWVRETFLRADRRAEGRPPWVYAADYADADRPRTRWTPSIYMPRAASRITLEVTGVRVERLQDISRGDAMAEGCPFANMASGPDPREWYRELWGEINGAGSWAANPWVWVVAFKRVREG